MKDVDDDDVEAKGCSAARPPPREVPPRRRPHQSVPTTELFEPARAEEPVRCRRTRMTRTAWMTPPGKDVSRFPWTLCLDTVSRFGCGGRCGGASGCVADEREDEAEHLRDLVKTNEEREDESGSPRSTGKSWNH